MQNITEIKSYLFKNKALLSNCLMIFACLFLYTIFPVDNTSLMQLLTKNVFFLFIVPALYIKIVLKKDLFSFGLNIKNRTKGIFWGIVLLAILFLLYFFLFSYTPLETKYSLPKNVTDHFSFFVVYELIIMNILSFTQEFFYRGFVISIFSEKFGFWSVLIQAAIFIPFFIFSNGFFWQFSTPVALSFANGFLFYKTRSFVFTYALNLLFIIILNSYIIYNIRPNI